MESASAKQTTRARTPREIPEERERYYLLPGQGGSNYRRKQRIIIKYSIIVGLLVSLIFGLAVYFSQRLPH
jgi:hypothetical protein